MSVGEVIERLQEEGYSDDRIIAIVSAMVEEERVYGNQN